MDSVVGIEFKKCISVFDKNGRFSPVFDENETKIVKTNHVLISVGQGMDWGKLLENSKVELNPNKTIKADSFTLANRRTRCICRWRCHDRS